MRDLDHRQHVAVRQFHEPTPNGTTDPPAVERLGLTEQELSDILVRYRQSMNLGVEDLARLIAAAEIQAASHRLARGLQFQETAVLEAKAAGVPLTRTSYGQLGKYKTVSKSSLKPGDLVGFYRGSHVGIYVGNGNVVHASTESQPVKVVPLSSMPYDGARRYA